MKTTLLFEGQTTNYKLTEAILLYHNEQNEAAATVHPIELSGQQARPTILPGKPISLLALENILAGLGRSNQGGFIPPNILSLSLNTLAWFCPASRRRIWFKPSNEPDAKRLKALNGKQAWHPPLVFCVSGRNLTVFALTDNHRPTAKTRTFRAPYWNLTDGQMCNGNLDLPPVSPDNIAAFEKAFFGSAFTHSSAGMLTNYRGGHTALWEHLTSRKTPPDAKFWKRSLIQTRNFLSNAIASAR